LSIEASALEGTLFQVSVLDEILEEDAQDMIISDDFFLQDFRPRAVVVSDLIVLWLLDSSTLKVLSIVVLRAKNRTATEEITSEKLYLSL
jgi:hypothetical protein